MSNHPKTDAIRYKHIAARPFTHAEYGELCTHAQQLEEALRDIVAICRTESVRELPRQQLISLALGVLE